MLSRKQKKRNKRDTRDRPCVKLGQNKGVVEIHRDKRAKTGTVPGNPGCPLKENGNFEHLCNTLADHPKHSLAVFSPASYPCDLYQCWSVSTPVNPPLFEIAKQMKGTCMLIKRAADGAWRWLCYPAGLTGAEQHVAFACVSTLILWDLRRQPSWSF